jgi:hypothetical protein
MPRPFKQGLDYFPLDVHIGQDDGVELIEAEYGLTGFAIVIKLYQRIYKKHGYFMEWNSATEILFCKRINQSAHTVNKIIDKCLEYEIFDYEKFIKYRILTSSGIQRRFFEAVSRRLQVQVDIPFICEGVFVGDYANLRAVNVDINSDNADSMQTETKVNVDINSINEGSSTQSKVKKSKGKNKTPFSTDSEPYQLAMFFYEILKKMAPTYKEPNLQTWSREIDLMIRIDHRTSEQIEWMIKFSNQHPFWRKNILSPKKLRLQWDRLVLEAKDRGSHIEKTSGKYANVG